jgi:hypothetical protein
MPVKGFILCAYIKPECQYKDSKSKHFMYKMMFYQFHTAQEPNSDSQ